MVFVKHNSLKSDIFFNPIFIPGFSGSRAQGSGPGFRSSLFDVVTFFDVVRITLYFGTFELCVEITLQLRFVFVRHCDIFFITSKLRCLFVRCTYAFLRRQNYVIFWYVRITYGNDVIITFHFCSSLSCIFGYITITLFVCSMQLRFSMTLEIGSILVRVNYVWK